MEEEARPSNLPRPAPRRLTALRRLLDAARAPIEFQILGRVLLHAALVGAAAGLLGSLFFAGVEAVQRVGARVAGRDTCRFAPAASGSWARSTTPPPFRPWLLLVVPAAGALIARGDLDLARARDARRRQRRHHRGVSPGERPRAQARRLREGARVHRSRWARAARADARARRCRWAAPWARSSASCCA